MGKLTLALAVMLGVSAPMYSDECDFDFEPEVEFQEVEEVSEKPSELKELIGAMKLDRKINKERVERLKNIIRDKTKQYKSKADPIETEPACEEV